MLKTCAKLERGVGIRALEVPNNKKRKKEKEKNKKIKMIEYAVVGQSLCYMPLLANEHATVKECSMGSPPRH